MKIEVGDCVRLYTYPSATSDDEKDLFKLGLVLETKDSKQIGHMIDNDVKCLVMFNKTRLLTFEWVVISKLELVYKNDKTK